MRIGPCQEQIVHHLLEFLDGQVGFYHLDVAPCAGQSKNGVPRDPWQDSTIQRRCDECLPTAISLHAQSIYFQ